MEAGDIVLNSNSKTILLGITGSVASIKTNALIASLLPCFNVFF